MSLSCFKSYDVRGELGRNFDASIVYRIGRAVADHLDAREIVVGFDARESSPELAHALISGINDAGSNVLNIGLAGTEEMYWAVTEFNACAGITITASHNPINFNGLKFVKSGSQPLDSKNDFKIIKQISEMKNWKDIASKGEIKNIARVARRAYVKKVLEFVDLSRLTKQKIIVNSGNGAAGPTFDAITKFFEMNKVPVEFIRMNHDPDSSFPNGIPNPMLIENHGPMRHKIVNQNADFGIAFDGDFDRCFFFDEKGKFIPGEYIVGLLAGVFLEKEPKASIVHDPRVVWNIRDIIREKGGVSVCSKTGHAFIKQAMRQAKAAYGGELSAHHYFRNFSYCDSGMIPWLLVLELVSVTGSSLGSLINKSYTRFPSSGEMNFKIKNPDKILSLIKRQYLPACIDHSSVDGVSLEFIDWRFNLRKSNTEALLRLNVECKDDILLLRKKITELSKVINSAN